MSFISKALLTSILLTVTILASSELESSQEYSGSKWNSRPYATEQETQDPQNLVSKWSPRSFTDQQGTADERREKYREWVDFNKWKDYQSEQHQEETDNEKDTSVFGDYQEKSLPNIIKSELEITNKDSDERSIKREDEVVKNATKRLFGSLADENTRTKSRLGSKLVKTEDMKMVYQSFSASYNLKNIKSLISPKLLRALASAGWKDDIAIVDSNFPATSVAKDENVIRMDGVPMIPLIKEIMKLLQLDKEKPLAIVANDENKSSRTVNDVTELVIAAEKRTGHEMDVKDVEKLSLSNFKERVKKVKFVVQSGEPGPLSSIIIRKGFITVNKCIED